MQPGKPGRLPRFRLSTRIVCINRRLIHLATAEADALTVFEVERRIQRQSDHWPVPYFAGRSRL